MRCLVVLAVLAGSVVPPAAAQRFPPDSFTNLKVLPKDIAPRELVTLMAAFTRALGVRCTFCHVGEEGRPIGTYEFAKDDKLPKRKAREMIKMVQAINDHHLSRLEERVEPRLAVQCATCHRGVREPRTLQDLLLGAYGAGGLDSTLARYRVLREQYYGRASYDFGEVTLTDVATAVWGQNRPADAVRLLELNVEVNPTSRFGQTQYAMRAIELAFRERGVAAGVAWYRALLARFGAEGVPEWAVNQLGYTLLRGGKPAEAVEIFKVNVEAYPESWNAHDSLGEGFAAVGDVVRAIASYERSLVLNAENANARVKLEELRRRGAP